MIRDETVAPDPPVSTWQTIRHGWFVFVPAVVGYAIVQYLLVLPNATPAPTPLFLGIVLVAYVFDVLLVATASITASGAARGLSFTATLRPHPARRLANLIGWSALWVAAISFAGVVSAIVAAVVVLVGAAAMPAIVAGRGLRAWLWPMRWVPARTLLWGLVAYLLLVIAALADAEFGFLVGDPLAAALSRVVTGFINVYLLCSATVLAERAKARRAAGQGADPTPVSSERSSPRRRATGSRRG